jgi:hypothetical protein
MIGYHHGIAVANKNIAPVIIARAILLAARWQQSLLPCPLHALDSLSDVFLLPVQGC